MLRFNHVGKAILILYVAGLTTFGQERNQPKTTGELDTVSSMSGVIVDTTDKNSSVHVAKEMSINLMQRLNLSIEQADEIEDVLIDYQQEIAEAKKNDRSNADEKNDPDKTDNLTGNESYEMMQEADELANQKIEDILDESQRASYTLIKKAWWQELKNRIYGETGTKTDEQNQEFIQDTLNNNR